MKKKLFLIIPLLCLFIPNLSADEGMWLLSDLKEQNEIIMKEMGLEIPIKKIYNAKGLSLKDAVVIFGRGCTGEVISKSGLVLTNHHCGYGNIQQLSSVENDYLTEGYWAKGREEELPCEGLTITFISKIYEVTSFVQEQLAKDDDPKGTNYLSPSYLKKVASRFAEQKKIKQAPFVQLELKPFYGGNKYYLFVKKVYQDIRLVGAPPSSIGKFGSDADNWMWPRHTGDFTLFRIYADEKGDPAPYSKQNKPLKVEKHLKISLAGYDEGDFVFLMGFPGSNSRYMIADEVVERMETTNSVRQKVREVRLAEMRDEMYKDPAVRIHYASIYASSANYWKNAIGMNEGLLRLKVIDEKINQQQQLLNWGREQDEMKYQVAFDSIQSIVKQRREPLLHQLYLEEALLRGMEFLKIPNFNALRESLQKGNQDEIDENLRILKKNGSIYFQNYNAFPEVEKRIGTAMLGIYQEEIDRNQQLEVFNVIENDFDGEISSYIDSCFKHSILGSPENFNSFIETPSLEKLSSDPIIELNRMIEDKWAQLNHLLSQSKKDYLAAHKVWVNGVMDMKKSKKEPIYPDANSTLRLTYGRVLPYHPADAITYDSYTTLKGVMEKEDAESRDFIVPDGLKKLYKSKDYGPYTNTKGELPVCFIINTDNTGGNSGSPVFNSKGELIGLGFDRNYEGLTGDIAFQPDLQRAVCVDIRYVLFIIDKFAGASYLLDELSFMQ
ncbi:MAG: S46 family peptidase [Bacteroidales bacterium]|nr:S46 family peptidase [Bacteroidales bacterium]